MKEKISLIGILVNSFLTVGKIAVGIFSHSASILAEGFHSLADLFSSLIGYFSIRMSQKPADEKHPYGHFKFEVLGGIIIVIFLLVAGIGTLFEAYKSYFDPQKIQIGYWSFVIMLVSIIGNLVTSKLKRYYGKKENSLALLTDGVHDQIDVWTSGAVLLGLFLSRYWVYTDSFLALLIGLYIVKESFSLGKEAVDSLLDVSAGEEVEKKIRSIVEEENIKLGSLKTQKKGSIVTANLEINLDSGLSVEKATQTSNNLRKKLINNIENLQYVVIQIESHSLETSFYQPSLGRGFGWQKKGKFQEKIEKATGRRPDGKCVCPKCGYSVLHKKGVPCSTIKCPKCNVNLERK